MPLSCLIPSVEEEEEEEEEVEEEEEDEEEDEEDEASPSLMNAKCGSRIVLFHHRTSSHGSCLRNLNRE